MSNRLFQGILHQMREAIDRTIGVMDDSFTVISCSNLGRIGEVHSITPPVNSDLFIKGSYTYKPFGTNNATDYILFVEGIDPQAARYAELLAIALSSIKQFYDEKYDRVNFVKNIILDNVLTGDIYLKARELHFNNDISRTVLLVRTPAHNDVSVFDVLQNLFPDKNKDFVISINDTDVAVVKEVHQDIDNKDLEKLARSIIDTLSGEFLSLIHI